MAEILATMVVGPLLSLGEGEGLQLPPGAVQGDGGHGGAA
jgi:hypothetical protein